MKCLLVITRWSEYERATPQTGRPHLDLFLNGLGFAEIRLREMDPDDPLDPSELPEEYALILVQGDYASRLRRSLISNLGLSLGLDGVESQELRVVGARPLLDAEGRRAGFAVRRRGRFVAFCERPVWEMRYEVGDALRALMAEDEPDVRPRKPPEYWLVEAGGEPFDLNDFLSGESASQCETRLLPDGDVALRIPPMMGAEINAGLREALGERLYATEPQPLEETLAELLRARRLKVGVAESCTGGLISARLTGLPGSSDYFTHGLVAYANEAKKGLVEGVGAFIDRCGAVSPEVALAMARGTLRVCNGDLAVSATGVAGPDGGSPEKPVGRVHLTAINREGEILEHKATYQGDRERVRFQASQTALHLLRRLALRRPPR